MNTNSRGAAMIKYLYGSHLEIMNRGDEPTFATRIRQEVIDITLSSTDIKREIYNWRVMTEVSLSDHRIVFVSKSYWIPESPINTETYPCSTDWELFSNELACSMHGKRYCKHLYNRWVCCKDSISDNQGI
jgi:hypothetical protein